MKELVIHDLPVTVQIDTTTGEFIPCLEKVARRVSDLAMMFSNQQIVQKIISMRLTAHYYKVGLKRLNGSMKMAQLSHRE